MKKIKGDIIWNTISSQTAGSIADLSSGAIYYFLGPKRALASMYAMSAIGSLLLLTQFQSNDTSYIPLLIMVSRYGISASFNMVFIAFVQLTPTVLAATIFGLCNVTGRAITALAPLVAELDDSTSMTINACGATFAAISSLFLIVKLPKFI